MQVTSPIWYDIRWHQKKTYGLIFYILGLTSLFLYTVFNGITNSFSLIITIPVFLLFFFALPFIYIGHLHEEDRRRTMNRMVQITSDEKTSLFEKAKAAVDAADFYEFTGYAEALKIHAGNCDPVWSKKIAEEVRRRIKSNKWSIESATPSQRKLIEDWADFHASSEKGELQ